MVKHSRRYLASLAVAGLAAVAVATGGSAAGQEIPADPTSSTTTSSTVAAPPTTYSNPDAPPPTAPVGTAPVVTLPPGWTPVPPGQPAPTSTIPGTDNFVMVMNCDGQWITVGVIPGIAPLQQECRPCPPGGCPEVTGIEAPLIESEALGEGEPGGRVDATPASLSSPGPSESEPAPIRVTG